MNPKVLFVLFISLIALGLFCFSLIFTFFRFVEVFLPLFFRGGMYVPSGNKRVKKMVDLLKIKEGEKAVDLGSGDGRLVISLAQAGAQAYGYEINPFLVARSRKKSKNSVLEKGLLSAGKTFGKRTCRNLTPWLFTGFPI